MLLHYLMLLWNCIFLAIVAAMIHELGHYIAARYFGYNIKFTLTFGMLFDIIPIPRGTWTMPLNATSKQQKIIALAGFGLEFIMIPVMLLMGVWQYSIIAIAHLCAYKYYAGDNSDFNCFKGM